MRYRKTPNKVFTVREATTLLPFLMKTFDGISRNKAKAILADSVWVDRQVVTQFDHPLRPGQVVEVSATPRRATLRNTSRLRPRTSRVLFHLLWLTTSTPVERTAST